MTGLNLCVYRKQIIEAQALKRNAEANLRETSKDLRLLKRDERQIEKAALIIQEVAKQTQEQLEYKVSELVSLALESIFPQPYRMRLIYETKRNKTEASFKLFKRGSDVGFNPLDSCGGGVVDVIALALRFTLWSFNPGINRTIVLDEPLKFLSKNLRPKAAELIKRLSEELGMQIIMTTHLDELIECADRVFESSIENGVSILEKR